MPGVYRQRRPEKTSLYGLLHTHGDEFRLSYGEQYFAKYGRLRPEVEKETGKYLKCGIPRFGFARIKCSDPECGESYLLPFSCKGRGICPSCLQKNMLETETWIVDNILREVPHRHFVFTIPKLLRRPFFHYREALNDLSRLAWRCVVTFMRESLGEGTPAAVQAIETSGEYLDTNPHIHAITTDGLFRADGTFSPMPKHGEGAQIYLLSLWKKAIADFVLTHQFITPLVMSKILGWQHTGFSVFAERRVDFKKSDEASVKEMRQLARYISKPPFALENIVWRPGADNVIYRGSGLHKWHKQNFETFEVLDFIAAVTAHIPNHRQKYVSYYGEYSNKTRGWKKKRGGGGKSQADSSPSEAQARFRQSWAVLIQKVWEVDPLRCPKCGSGMKVVAIVGDVDLVEVSLRRMGLWEDPPPRGPPISFSHPPPDEVIYEPCSADGWDDLPADA